MPHNQKIEEILEAWYEWDRGDPSARGESKKQLYQLVDAVRAGTDFEAEQILDHLWDDYLEYRASRRRNERVQVARSARRKLHRSGLLSGNPDVRVLRLLTSEH